MKLESIRIKHSNLTEKWVQDQIAEDPSILGLGDLVVKDKERNQQGAGRLDLLLQDPEISKRYETEIQLGATDESHIIRTIEYWDVERKRYPQYEHVAVIIAEDITSRFLNVIQLFNGNIPLIAIKMTAYKIGNEYALTFVKVLDEMSFGLVDEDEPITEPTDRAFWETKRGTKETLLATDSLFKLVKEIESQASLKYNKHYIGIEIKGVANNFVTFFPRKAHIVMSIKLPKTSEIDALLEDAEFDILSYDAQYRQYKLRLGVTPFNEKQSKTILELIKQAHGYYVKSV